MKLEPYKHWNNTSCRQPLRSAKEIATMLNLTMPQLRGYLAKVGAPKPELVHRKSGSWYNPVEFKRWFKGVK